MAVVRITHVSPPAPTNYGRLSLSPSPSLSLVCISAAQPLKERDPLAPRSSSSAAHTTHAPTRPAGAGARTLLNATSPESIRNPAPRSRNGNEERVVLRGAIQNKKARRKTAGEEAADAGDEEGGGGGTTKKRRGHVVEILPGYGA